MVDTATLVHRVPAVVSVQLFVPLCLGYIEGGSLRRPEGSRGQGGRGSVERRKQREDKKWCEESTTIVIRRVKVAAKKSEEICTPKEGIHSSAKEDGTERRGVEFIEERSVKAVVFTKDQISLSAVAEQLYGRIEPNKSCPRRWPPAAQRHRY